jgi:hypothetical protein
VTATTPFVDLRPVESWAKAAVRKDRFLGRLDAPALRRELDEAGLLAGLAARGYPNVLFRISMNGDEHRLRLLAPGLVTPLVDLSASESTALLKDPPRLPLGLEVFSFLTVRRLVLQDPRSLFRDDRPRLPGQEHPGLGLFQRALDRLRLWAEDWGKDGLLGFPPHFHAAVLPGQALRFLSPGRQGRFEALQRHLGALSLAEASWAVEEGRVTEEPGGAALVWQPAEAALPLGHDLRDYIESEDYSRAVEQARGTVYRFSPPHASQGQSARSNLKL